MTETIGPWSVWLLQGGGVMDIETFQTRDEALGFAAAARDMGWPYPETVEGPDGVVPQDEVDAYARAVNERAAADDAVRVHPHLETQVLDATGSRWAAHERFSDEAKADADLAALRAVFGPERVRMRTLERRS